MKYRTKPFEIEAIQFTGTNFGEVQAFCGVRSARWNPDVDIQNFEHAGTYASWEDEEIVAEVYDYLHSTWVGVRAGDYIIRGSREEYYPCDPFVFNSKYELVINTENFDYGPSVIRTKDMTMYWDGTAFVKRLTDDGK